MAIYIDLPKAMELVDAAIARKGEDYVYPNWEIGCQYVDYAITQDKDGDVQRICRTGCIVGEALLDVLNVDMDSLSRHGTNENGVYDFLDYLRRIEAIDGCTVDAEEYLTLIQVKQDRGETWGEARQGAKEELNL